MSNSNRITESDHVIITKTNERQATRFLFLWPYNVVVPTYGWQQRESLHPTDVDGDGKNSGGAVPTHVSVVIRVDDGRGGRSGKDKVPVLRTPIYDTRTPE